MKQKPLAIMSLIFLIILDIAMADNFFPIYVRNRPANTVIELEINYSVDSACSNILFSDVENVAIDNKGTGFMLSNITTITTTPSFICEYQDNALVAVHIWNDKWLVGNEIIFNDVVIDNFEAGEIGINGTLTVDNYFYQNGNDINKTIDDKLTGNTWIPVINFTQFGTVEDGNISLIQNYDEQAFNITEVVPNAITYFFNTSSNASSEINLIRIRYKFTGSDSLTISLQETDGSWESYMILEEASDFIWNSAPISDISEHLIDNKIVGRIEHTGTAKLSHKLSIDQIVISSGFTPAPPFITPSIHTDGSNSPIADIDFGGNTLYNVKVNMSDDLEMKENSILEAINLENTRDIISTGGSDTEWQIKDGATLIYEIAPQVDNDVDINVPVGDYYLNTDIIFGMTTPKYKWSARSLVALALQPITAGLFSFDMFPNSAGNSAFFTLWKNATPASVTNGDFVQFKNDYANRESRIISNRLGGGLLQALGIRVGSTESMKFKTDNTIRAIPTYSKLITSGGIKPLVSNSSGDWGVEPSSEEYKENIRAAENTSKIYDLEVVNFNMIGSDETRTGLTAEQTAEINPEWVTYKTEVIKECINDTNWAEEGIIECNVIDIITTNQSETVKYSEIFNSMLQEIQNLRNVLCEYHPEDDLCK